MKFKLLVWLFMIKYCFYLNINVSEFSVTDFMYWKWNITDTFVFTKMWFLSKWNWSDNIFSCKRDSEIKHKFENLNHFFCKRFSYPDFTIFKAILACFTSTAYLLVSIYCVNWKGSDMEIFRLDPDFLLKLRRFRPRILFMHPSKYVTSCGAVWLGSLDQNRVGWTILCLYIIIKWGNLQIIKHLNLQAPPAVISRVFVMQWKYLILKLDGTLSWKGMTTPSTCILILKLFQR